MTIAESWHDLEADLLGPEPDYDTEPPVELDRSTADRYLRRIAHLDAQRAADMEVAEAQIEQVRAWLAGRYETYSAQRAWLHGVLERFHQALLALDPKAKTVHLPSGDLHMRAQPAKWEFTDTAAFLAWALENLPQATNPAGSVPVPASINVNAAKKALTKTIENERGKVIDKVLGVVPDTMECPPGLKVDEVPDKFSVDFTVDEPEVHDDTRERAEEAADRAPMDDYDPGADIEPPEPF